MSRLLDPFTLRGVTLRNRVAAAPVSVYASGADGALTDWHLVHLGSRALGGFGLVFTEALAVSPEGRGTPYCAGLWDDGQLPAIERVGEFVRNSGAVFGIQLAHEGRRASATPPWDGGHHLTAAEGGWETIAATSVPAGGPLWKVPRIMVSADIERVLDAFGAAAGRAASAGCGWLDLNFAQGYLQHCFLSPVINRRTDQYGGGFENRIRFAVETVRRVRGAWPRQLPLSVHLSVGETDDAGATAEEAVELAVRLRSEGVDLVALRHGYVSLESATESALTMVPAARRFRRAAGVGTAVVWTAEDSRGAADLVRAGDADLIFATRGAVLDPFWLYRAAVSTGDRVPAVLLPRAYAQWTAPD